MAVESFGIADLRSAIWSTSDERHIIHKPSRSTQIPQAIQLYPMIHDRPRMEAESGTLMSGACLAVAVDCHLFTSATRKVPHR